MKNFIFLFLLFNTSISVHAETIYKAIPGTPFKDPTEPIMVIEKNGIYPTIPGTTIRDYSQMPGYVIE